MSSLLRTLRSSTSGNIPATTTAAGYGELAVNLADRKVFARDSTGQAQVVADRVLPYDAMREYVVNDLTIQAAILYRCIIAIPTPEGFDPANWEAIGVAAGLDGAILIAPNSDVRNTITPTSDYPGLRILPAGGQSVPLVNINGSFHDKRGLPIGRYGEAVYLVSQTSHPFSAVGQPAAYVHPNWVLAQAGNATLSVRAVVHEIIDTNNVLLQMSGQVRNLSTAAFAGGVITPGLTYFLSSTAGRLSATPDASGAQAALLVTSATTGLLLLSNAAGSAIVSRAPGGQAQTIFEPLSILNTAGSAGLRITPNTQALTSVGGTPVSLTFQQDGVLAVGGQLSVTGNITIANSAPQLLLTETDQTSPAGRTRLFVSGGDIYLQELLTEPSTYATIWRTDTAGFTITPQLTVTGGIFNPTLIPSAADVDGSIAMTIDIAREWSIGQFNAGSSTGLELRALIPGGKNLRIVDSTRTSGFHFNPETRALSGIGGALAITGDVVASGKVTAASAAIGAFEINVTGSVFRRTAGSIIYDVPLGFQHLFRINNVGAATVDPPGTIVVNSLSIITAEKGDNRYLRLAGGQTVAGLVTFSGQANFTDGVVAERIRIGVKTVDTIDNLSASILFNVPASSVYAFDVNDIEAARISAAGTSVPNVTTVITAQKGDNRYPMLVGGRVPISQGGTAANDASEARVNLGANNASNLTTGTIPAAQLGTSSAYRDWVLERCADAGANYVGSYAILYRPGDNVSLVWNATYGGSLLRSMGFRVGTSTEENTVAGNDTVSGTWRAMGDAGPFGSDSPGCLMLRIA